MDIYTTTTPWTTEFLFSLQKCFVYVVLLSEKKMIRRLQIRGFRTHERQDIKFSPRVNSIIGRNATGKSTLIRAIRWVARNKPAGASVINWDAEKASVRLTSGKHKVTRIKGKNINSYRLDGKMYKAFGNDVPGDIKKVLGLSDINFQGQHDAPFWFCETAGEVSRQLNIIVNLEVIDTTLSKIVTALHKSRTTIEVVEDRLGKATNQLSKLSHVEEMDEALCAIENLQTQRQAKAVEAATIRETVKLVQIYQAEQENSRELNQNSRFVLAKGSNYQEIVGQVKTLSKAVELGSQLQQAIKARPPSLGPLEKARIRVKKIVNQYNELETLTIRVNELEEKKCQVRKELNRCEEQLGKIARGQCPLCGAAMKK